MMKRTMPERDVRMALDELRELHAHWEDEMGVKEADRRFRRQVRQYPFRLLVSAIASVGRAGPWASPRSVLLSVRSLLRAPGLTAAIVLTVGVGIGGCTAIFAVVDALFLRPLPYPDAERLVWIYTDSPPNQWPFSVVDFQALQEQQTSFEAVAAYDRNTRTFVTAEGAELITAIEGTPGLFDLLGVPLLSGRAPSIEDGSPQAHATTLVTRGFASRHLGSVDPDGSDVLGNTVRLDGEEYSVIGILPASFGPLARDSEVFPTLRVQQPERKGPFFLQAFGRLRSNVGAAQASEELQGINARLFPVWADSYQDERASWGMLDLAKTLQGDSGRLLTILMGAVAMLLLVAVANAANLLLARVTARHREISVRKALGATRAQVASHLLTESMLLAVGGVGIGLLLARGGIEILPTVAGSYIPRLAEVHLDGTVMGFAGVLAVGCGLLFGLIPTLHGIGGAHIAQGLRSGSRTSTQTAREQRLQRLLVAAQLTVVVPLLAGAGLLLTSFVNLEGTDPGFAAENLVSMRVSPSPAAFPDPETRNQFWTSVLDRVSALPEVASVGIANGRPPRESSTINNFDLEDRPTAPGQSQPSAPWIMANPEYFETLGVPLIAGRMFEELDREYEPEVAIVDVAWAERFFPGEDVVGRRFRHGGCTECEWTTVVGVVGEVPYLGLGGEGSGAVYQPDPLRFSSAPFLFLRTRAEPEQIVSRVRAEVFQVDPSTPLTQVQTGESLLQGSLAQPRHLMLLLVTFSGVALALAIVGLYGITAYSVQQRRGDIAVRLALGGSPSAVLRMVLRQGMALTVVGLLAGTMAALGLTRVMATLLYEVSPRDPMTLLGVAVLLLSVSAVACLIPGRRAVRLDPSSTLREE
jgi:putative ABC transport system permease protein